METQAVKYPVKIRDIHSNHFDSTVWDEFNFRDEISAESLVTELKPENLATIKFSLSAQDFTMMDDESKKSIL